MPTSTKLRISHLAKKMNHEKQFVMKNCMTWAYFSIQWTRWQLICFNVSSNNGKTHDLQTRKYDINMTSPVAKNVWLFYQWNTWFLLNIPWKFCGNLSIFHRDIKENVSGCFLPGHSVVWFIELVLGSFSAWSSASMDVSICLDDCCVREERVIVSVARELWCMVSSYQR